MSADRENTKSHESAPSSAATRYATIVADPPWAYPGGVSAGGTPGKPITSYELPYDGMTLDEIKAIDVPALAMDNAWLALWTTNRYLVHAFEVLGAWGFKYRQCLVWHKLGPSPFGGTWAPNGAEFLLAAARGNPPNRVPQEGRGSVGLAFTSSASSVRRAGSRSALAFDASSGDGEWPVSDETTTRKYAMTRIAAGDYLLPSNDGETLWRIYSYTEDGSAEWQDSSDRWHKLTGTFWAIAKYKRPFPESGEIPYDFLEWENWETWETTLRTQKLAIEATLR